MTGYSIRVYDIYRWIQTVLDDYTIVFKRCIIIYWCRSIRLSVYLSVLRTCVVFHILLHVLLKELHIALVSNVSEIRSIWRAYTAQWCSSNSLSSQLSLVSSRCLATRTIVNAAVTKYCKSHRIYILLLKSEGIQWLVYIIINYITWTNQCLNEGKKAYCHRHEKSRVIFLTLVLWKYNIIL